MLADGVVEGRVGAVADQPCHCRTTGCACDRETPNVPPSSLRHFVTKQSHDPHNDYDRRDTTSTPLRTPWLAHGGTLRPAWVVQPGLNRGLRGSLTSSLRHAASQTSVAQESRTDGNVRQESLTYANVRLESLTYANVRLESLTYGERQAGKRAKRDRRREPAPAGTPDRGTPGASRLLGALA